MSTMSGNLAGIVLEGKSALLDAARDLIDGIHDQVVREKKPERIKALAESLCLVEQLYAQVEARISLDKLHDVYSKVALAKPPSVDFLAQAKANKGGN